MTDPSKDANSPETAAIEADATSETEEAPEGEPEFANRAARRAKGKGGSQPPPHASGANFHGRGSVQGPRQYGARRSG